MRPHDSISRVLLSCCLPLIVFSFTTLAVDDLPTFKKIQQRYEAVHAHVAPAVVAVQCAGSNKSGAGFYGTGVVVSPEGLVLTSATVVPAGTKTVEVLFTDGRVMNAKVLAFDNTTESCLLQITRGTEESKTPLPYLELSDSSKIHVG